MIHQLDSIDKLTLTSGPPLLHSSMAPTTHSSSHSSVPLTSNPTPSSSCPQVLPSVQEVSLDYKPDYTPKPQDNEDSILNLTEAITLMTKELKHCDSTPNSSGANAKQLDTFDGINPKKLNNFILLCNLFFWNNSVYSNDEAKVTFALFYLCGITLEYFEPTLMDSDKDLEWLTDWSVFIQVLHTQFGSIDPTANAEDNLDNLRMCDNHHIVKYNVNFNHLAIQTSWDDSVLTLLLLWFSGTHQGHHRPSRQTFYPH